MLPRCSADSGSKRRYLSGRGQPKGLLFEGCPSASLRVLHRGHATRRRGDRYAGTPTPASPDRTAHRSPCRALAPDHPRHPWRPTHRLRRGARLVHEGCPGTTPWGARPQFWSYPITMNRRTQPALSRAAASGSMPHLRFAVFCDVARYMTT